MSTNVRIASLVRHDRGLSLADRTSRTSAAGAPWLRRRVSRRRSVATAEAAVVLAARIVRRIDGA
jgi:hypothetical protein